MSCNRGRQACRKWSHNLGTPRELVQWLWTLLCSRRNTWTWSHIQLLSAAARASEYRGVLGVFPRLLSQCNTSSGSCKRVFLYSVKAGLAMKWYAQILKIKFLGCIAVSRLSPSSWVAETSRRNLRFRVVPPVVSSHLFIPLICMVFIPHHWYTSFAPAIWMHNH